MVETAARKPTTSSICAQKIRDMILENKLRPGDRLPPERELAQQLGVNRMTLRAALAELQATNLIVARQGSGNVVTAYREIGSPALLADLVRLESPSRKVELCADLLLLRRQLAVAALTKLLNLGDRDVSAIERAVERFGEVAERCAPIAEIAAADLAVVMAMLDATRSPAFRLIINPVARALEALPELREVLYAKPDQNAAHYAKLVAWLRQPTERGIGQLLELLTGRDEATIDQLRERIAPGS